MRVIACRVNWALGVDEELTTGVLLARFDYDIPTWKIQKGE
jgi:hypothetical protein